MSEVLEPQPIEGQNQDQAAQVAASVQDNPNPDGTQHEGEGDKPKAPRMVPVTALQQERQRRQQEAAQRRELEAELAQYRSAAPQQQKPQEPQRPKASDFRTEEEYLDAVERYADERATRKVAPVARETVEEILQGREQETHAKAVLGTFQQRISEAEATIPDIVERVQDLEADPLIRHVDQSIRMALLASDVAPQLIQALTDDPRRLEALTGDPVRAAFALARLEASLSQKPYAASAPNPAAPPPGPAVKTTARVSGSAPQTKSLAWIAANGSQAEYEAARKAGVK